MGKNVEQKAIKTFSISQYLTKVFYANVHTKAWHERCDDDPNIEKTPHCIALGIEYETEQAKVVILIQFIDFFLCVHTNFYYSKCIWYLHVEGVV